MSGALPPPQYVFMAWCLVKAQGPRPDRLWGPSNFLSKGYQGRHFPGGIKNPGCESDNTPPSSGENKNAQIYTSTPP